MSRRRTRAVWAVNLLAALAAAVWLRVGPSSASRGASGDRQMAVVLHVVDGDTLYVTTGGTRTPVRLIGIDTPESRDNPKARRDSRRSGKDLETICAQGRRATEFVKGLVGPGKVLGLEFDVQKNDRYGRLLAYAYLADGRMLNEVIARAGFAAPMTIPPNVRYVERFRAACDQARRERAGLWAGDGG